MTGLFGDLPDLPKHLEKLLAQIPSGRVATYGALAEALGDRIAARWVGHFLLHHDHRRACPCHRVVRVTGQVGEYIAGGPSAKARRLAAEGVKTCQGAVDLSQCEYDRFVGDRPLEKLGQVQAELVAKAVLSRRRRLPKRVGGVDVAYPDPRHGVAAYALVEVESGKLVWSATVSRAVAFPYITSFLAFRELPILLDLIGRVRRAGRLAEMVLVDGSGILHQRHAGIATHLGVVACLPTVGVTKKLLCGTVELEGIEPHESRPVVHEGRVIGVALRPTAGSRRPVFVSPGHRTNVAFAERLVRTLLLGHRLPEPIYWADRLSRKAARARAGPSRSAAAGL